MAVIEQWKPVVGFEGRYEVSDQGRVRALDRTIEYETKNGKVARYVKKGQRLRPGRASTGYLSVCIGTGNTQNVHVLVAAAFLGVAPPKTLVCHKNGDKRDNRAVNLYYGTVSTNNRDVVRHRRRKPTLAQIRKIRRVAGTYLGSNRDLAEEMGLSQAHVSMIKIGANYGWVK